MSTVSRNFYAETEVDPFARSITIASACSVVFRRNYLRPETIAIIPALGYRKEHTHSKVAILWLKWLSFDRNIKIRHARNGGEVKVGKFRVDGLYEKTIFEFHGCVWHGCPRCYRRRDIISPTSALTMHERYEETVKRTKALERAGYRVEEMWECDFNRARKENPRMAAFLKTEPSEESPLCPRDAFFGGRTNAAKLFHKAGPGEKIRYVDVCSLYPWVCKYGKFPLGHPEIITENFDADLSRYEGFIKADVVPPRGL